MIRQTSNDDILLADQIRLADPFQQATPIWRVHILPLLPPETLCTLVTHPERRLTNMAIRVVQDHEAPERLLKRGVTNQDYNDVITELTKPRDKNAKIAFVVDMTPELWKLDNGQPNPKAASVFAYSIRRYLERGSLPITAFQSGPMQITIRNKRPTDPKFHGSGAGKKK